MDRALGMWLRAGGLLVCAALGCAASGCASGAPEVEQPDAEVRISRLLHLYQAYAQKHQKGPPNEQALKEFAAKLTSKEKEDFSIGDDVEGIFVSPRDNKPFGILYNVRLDPSQNRAIIWEETGKDGMRYVALSIGYVTQCDEQTFKDYRK